MTKYILFSEPQEQVLAKIAPELFLKSNMKIAYMPSDGANPSNPKYESFWKSYIENHNSGIVPINNSVRDSAVQNESEKIINSDALILTGGNTFQFLSHLKRSGLDNTIVEFSKSDKIIVGFSAGAIILSSTIEIAQLPPCDENLIGLTDLSALNLIEFDIYPHYDEIEHKNIVDEYEKKTGRSIKRLTNEDLLIIN